ncbi:hypothetical protein BJ085DRAFT_38557 [Dimargaris cristalligena]|uniref:Uncharacterized protein n=1 Tax=Dimargaris cristalligena TaxID=215637 RepID=A0A4P9ZKV1_9FUNG|nr:hypothetical protein BJ085DRAFT_38557 [Dimargaris cristalligena]|eukprot:RKP33916.1 hypothetical protein BJ085DRAFT_38557 [Dimargaris cristalligena]
MKVQLSLSMLALAATSTHAAPSYTDIIGSNSRRYPNLSTYSDVNPLTYLGSGNAYDGYTEPEYLTENQAGFSDPDKKLQQQKSISSSWDPQQNAENGYGYDNPPLTQDQGSNSNFIGMSMPYGGSSQPNYVYPNYNYQQFPPYLTSNQPGSGYPPFTSKANYGENALEADNNTTSGGSNPLPSNLDNFMQFGPEDKTPYVISAIPPPFKPPQSMSQSFTDQANYGENALEADNNTTSGGSNPPPFDPTGDYHSQHSDGELNISKANDSGNLTPYSGFGSEPSSHPLLSLDQLGPKNQIDGSPNGEKLTHGAEENYDLSATDAEFKPPIGTYSRDRKPLMAQYHPQLDSSTGMNHDSEYDNEALDTQGSMEIPGKSEMAAPGRSLKSASLDTLYDDFADVEPHSQSVSKNEETKDEGTISSKDNRSFYQRWFGSKARPLDEENQTGPNPDSTSESQVPFWKKYFGGAK